MVRFLLLGLLFISQASYATGPVVCNEANRGKLMSVTHFQTMTRNQLKAYFDSWIALYGEFVGADADPVLDYGADVYKMAYCTVDFNDAPTVASGVVSLPVARPNFPLPNRLSTVSYQHGTSVTRTDTVSNLDVESTFDGPTPLAFFTGAGYIYIAADYLGYGDSNLPRHRYFHAKTEASASADLLSASEQVPALQAANRNSKLFLYGFSQGGHASMALHRKLEAQGKTVTAHATIGGVYNPEAWLLKSVFDPEGETPEYISTYISFMTLAYDDVYNTYGNINNVFKAPYAGTVEGLFDMSNIFDDVAFSLPPTSQELLTNSWRNQLQNSPSMEFRQRLRQNEVYKWTPCAPIKFFHSVSDDEVDYDLARDAFDYLKDHGAPITFRTMNGFNHLSSWHHAMPLAVQYFDTF